MNSVIGLGTVRRVRLQSLKSLKSLQGLGGNHNGSNSEYVGNEKVDVEGCPLIKDFSPLKHVKDVFIEDCEGLTNAADLEHVHTLSLSLCRSIVDVSALYRVQNLSLQACNRIRSIAGLENVPFMEVKECRHLPYGAKDAKEGEVPIYKRDFGVRVSHDSLTLLPDSLYPEIFKFLDDDDRMSCIACNTFLYQRLIRHYRLFQIEWSDAVVDFFVDSLFREELLDRMNDPTKQLSLSPDEEPSNFYPDALTADSTVTFPGFYKVSTTTQTFIDLVERFPNVFPCIRHLDLEYVEDFFDDDDDEDGENDASHASNTKVIELLLPRVKESLKLSGMALPLNIQFPISLEELELRRCVFDGDLPLPPHLRSLKLKHCVIPNLSAFSYVQYVTLESIYDAIDLAALSSVKNLYLNNCFGIKDFTPLQGNELISILYENDDGYSDTLKYDFSHAFTRTKKIFLRFFGDLFDVNIDLCHYEALESLVIAVFDSSVNFITKKTGVSKQNTKNQKKAKKYNQIHPLFSCPVPTAIKSLMIETLPNFLNKNIKAMNHTEVMKFQRYDPHIPLVDTIQNIGSFRLDLSSKSTLLQGFDANQQRRISFQLGPISDVTTIEEVEEVHIKDCIQIEHIAELKGTRRLYIENCPKLTTMGLSRTVKRVELRNCNNLYSAKWLNQVPEVVVRNCGCFPDLG